MSPRGTPNPWTENEITRLHQLSAKGVSLDEIAGTLGRSKRTIVRKRSEIGIRNAKPNSKPKKEKKKKAESRKPSKLLSIAAPHAKPAPLVPAQTPVKWPWPALKSRRQVTIWDIQPGQCRWPNDGSVLDGTFRYCGAKAPQWPTCLYCATHMRMAWARTIEKVMAA